MIHSVETNCTDIDTFICYRHDMRIVAAQLKKAMDRDKKRDYGKVWYSNSQSSGNYLDDIDPLLESAEKVVLILWKGFLDGFVDDVTGEVKDRLTDDLSIRITIKELQKIEELREKKEIEVFVVNVDGYSFSPEEIRKLVRVLKSSEKVKADEGELVTAWAFRNENPISLDSVIDLDEFSDFLEKRLADQLKLFFLEPEEQLTFFDERNYAEMFYQLLSDRNRYPNVAYFGYGGGVFFNNLFTGNFGYEKQQSSDYAHKNIRILLRNPIIEAKEEREQSVSFSKRTRKKSRDMMTLYDRAKKKNEGIGIEVRFYDHTPFIKGSLFCDEDWNPLAGIINFESAYGKSYQEKGGSPFKGIDSDMIYFNGVDESSPNGRKADDNPTMKALRTLITQFNMDWDRGKMEISEEKVCSPLHLNLQDDYYPNPGEIKRTRECVRAVLLNEDNEVALHYVHRDDKYGNSYYYELPGGGVELGEEPFEAIEREVSEEAGFEVSLLAYLGDAKDTYNLSKRHNHHHFFLLRTVTKGEKHFVSEGDELIQKTVFLPLSEAVSIMEKQHQGGFEGLVRQRELPFLKLALNMLNNGYID